jgi:serine/threonine protein kinase
LVLSHPGGREKVDVSVPDTTEPLKNPSQDEGTQLWHDLSGQIDALVAAWDNGPRPPSLKELLPAAPAESRRMMLIELIKVDLEYRWQQYDLPKRIEDYLAEFPELAEGNSVSCGLIYEEYLIRRRTASPPKPDEYLRRFPHQAEELRRLFTIQPSAVAATTTLAVGSRRPPVDVGSRIDDFDILIRLGQGAFASVFLAKQRSMQRLVALKISRDHGDETRTLAQLDHPHIVRVFDQRVLEDQQLRLMYMEHVPGGTLQAAVDQVRADPDGERRGQTILSTIDTALERKGVTPPHDSSLRRRLGQATWPQAICWLGARLAAALDYAHGLGVLHRDVKPANVLLAADGSPKLADFNVSFSSKLDGATPAAYFGGSLAYMSPEQLEASNPSHSRQADELDGRSDVYSLAVMLWELLTGSRPFGEERVAANMGKTLEQLAERRRAGVTPAAIASLPRDLPAGMEEVLLSCLSPDVEKRPASAGVMARQLDICLQPRAQRLFRPRPGTIRRLMQRFAIITIVLGGVVPNAFCSVFNTVFNIGFLLNHFSKAEQTMFWRVQIGAINGIAYAGGTALGLYLFWPVIKAVMARLGTGTPSESEELLRVRRRSLWCGDYVSWITLGLWIVSGFAFSLGLMSVGDYSPDKAKYYFYFFLSQIVCGLIASTQTFFFLTFVSVRVLHPLLVQPERSQVDEVKDLLRLEARAPWYLGVAVIAPFLAFITLALIELPGAGKICNIVMALIGVAGSFLAYGLMRTTQRDIAALVATLDPERTASQSSSASSDSFWTSSR